MSYDEKTEPIDAPYSHLRSRAETRRKQRESKSCAPKIRAIKPDVWKSVHSKNLSHVGIKQFQKMIRKVGNIQLQHFYQDASQVATNAATARETTELAMTPAQERLEKQVELVKAVLEYRRVVLNDEMTSPHPNQKQP